MIPVLVHLLLRPPHLTPPLQPRFVQILLPTQIYQRNKPQNENGDRLRLGPKPSSLNPFGQWQFSGCLWC